MDSHSPIASNNHQICQNAQKVIMYILTMWIPTSIASGLIDMDLFKYPILILNLNNRKIKFITKIIIKTNTKLIKN